MKKNLNVIQIKGVKGLIMLVMVGCCLVAGFIVFPGWVAMNIWNVLASLVNNAPSIGIIQGVLLWGIIVASYFTFRKERVVVCMKTPQGLNEEELKILNNLVSGYFDFAEIQAIRHNPMYMKDYIKQLDMILSSTGEKMLNGSGSISHKKAIQKAKAEYRKYQVKTISPVEEEYLNTIKEINNKIEKKEKNV